MNRLTWPTMTNASAESPDDPAVERLDRDRLLAWFVEQELPVDPQQPLAAELLARGRSNVTYRIRQGDPDSGAIDWVVRRQPFGHVMPSAHDMAREHRVISGVYAGGFAVPQPIALFLGSRCHLDLGSSMSWITCSGLLLWAFQPPRRRT